MRKLWAISDLHLDYRINREALEELPHFGQDWLITVGDLCSSTSALDDALEVLCDRFEKVFWVPGNHELWSGRKRDGEELLRGEAKYLALVEVCRKHGVSTPEDPFLLFPDSTFRIAPLFVGYDYSFKPEYVAEGEEIDWAMESGILCNDEKLINPVPYDSIRDWCRARLDYSLARLGEVDGSESLIMAAHFPLRKDLVRLKRIPRFVIWCGTRETEPWHLSFPTTCVVSGHLHLRATDYRDGVRFEEVSLGYPRDWNQAKGMAYYLRQILPAPPKPAEPNHGPEWRFY